MLNIVVMNVGHLYIFTSKSRFEPKNRPWDLPAMTVPNQLLWSMILPHQGIGDLEEHQGALG
jgi:hypothetical protein